jgi:hypothetical protein
MNITDIYNASRSNVVLAQSYARQMSNTPGTSSPNAQEAGKAQKSYNYADIKAQQQVAATQEKISNLGQVKSSFSDAQNAAKEMKNLKTDASAEDMAAAANKMVGAYNNTLKSSMGNNNGNQVDSVEARRAGTNLRGAVTGGGLSNELRDAGFSVATDGSIKVDQDKFKAAAAKDPEALRKALDNMGQKVEAGTAKTLDAKSELNTSINNLKKNSAELETKRAASASGASSTSSSGSTSTVGRYVSPAEMTNNAEKTLEEYNKKIRAGGTVAANAKKELAGSDLAKELEKAGVTQNQDGTLSMDRNKFRAAAAANSNSLGSAMDKVGKLGSTDSKTNTAVAASKEAAAAETSTQKVDRSAEARRLEQERFEAQLSKKYQSYASGSNPQTQRFGFFA